MCVASAKVVLLLFGMAQTAGACPMPAGRLRFVSKQSLKQHDNQCFLMRCSSDTRQMFCQLSSAQLAPALLLCTGAIFFNVIVRNAGQAALTGATLQVTDTGAAIGPEISVDTAAQSCQLGSPIPAGETRTCLVTLRPKQDNLDAGFPLVITAAGTATDAVSKESISASSAEVNVPAAQNAKLEYQLTADATGLSTLPAADEPVKYTLKIFNKGNVRLTDVAPAFKVNDAAALLDFSGCLSDLQNSEAGEQLSKTSCEVTRKLKQSDIEKGSLDVTGSLSATYT